MTEALLSEAAKVNAARAAMMIHDLPNIRIPPPEAFDGIFEPDVGQHPFRERSEIVVISNRAWPRKNGASPSFIDDALAERAVRSGAGEQKPRLSLSLKVMAILVDAFDSTFRIV